MGSLFLSFALIDHTGPYIVAFALIFVGMAAEMGLLRKTQRV